MKRIIARMLEKKYGKSWNRFCSVYSRIKSYHDFCFKCKLWLDDYEDKIDSDLNLLPMEEEDGIDTLAYIYAQKIKKLDPESITFTIQNYFSVKPFYGKTTKVSVPKWFSNVMKLTDDYACRHHQKSIREYFIFCMCSYLGTCDETNTWVYDGRSNEQKVFDIISKKSTNGDTIEYQPGWFVSVIHPTTKHRPGLDGISDFRLIIPRTISEEKLVELFSAMYGMYTYYDEILSGYNWKR